MNTNFGIIISVGNFLRKQNIAKNAITSCISIYEILFEDCVQIVSGSLQIVVLIL